MDQQILFARLNTQALVHAVGFPMKVKICTILTDPKATAVHKNFPWPVILHAGCVAVQLLQNLHLLVENRRVCRLDQTEVPYVS